MKSTTTILIIFLCCSITNSQNYQVNWSNKISNSSSILNIEDDDWFGYYVEPIGDLDNNKVTDLAISAVKDDDGDFNKGAVYILYMNQNGTVDSYQKISQTQGNFGGLLNQYELFGTGLKYLGDINNDGNFELAVAAEYNNEFNYRSGRLWILSINNSGVVQNTMKIPENNILNLSTWDVFGSDVTTVGDLDNNGTVDLAVGSRRYNDKGAVYILFMNPDLTIQSYNRIASHEGGFGNLDYQDYFGGAVVNIGDLDDNGIPELAVSAYRDDDGGNNKGAVYILFLDQNGDVINYQKISESDGNFNDTLINNTQFGLSVSEIDDINEDGLKEIIVSASGWEDASQNQFGAFYILNLNNDGTVNSYIKYANGLQNLSVNSEGGDGFAMSVANIGISNNNSYNIAIGSYLDVDNQSEFQRGSFYVINLSTTFSVNEFSHPDNYIYPNPTRNKIFIKNTDNLNQVSIYDYNGKLISSINDVEHSLDFSYLPVGSYLVKLNYLNGRNETFKVLKE